MLGLRENLSEDDKIRLEGSFPGRHYPEGFSPHKTEVRTAYEISANTMEQLEKHEAEDADGDCDSGLASVALGKNS